VAFACALAVALACALAVAFAWALAVAEAVLLAVADAFAAPAASAAVCGFFDAAVAVLVVETFVTAGVLRFFAAAARAALTREAVCAATVTEWVFRFADCAWRVVL
jgi:hypothetical protein